MSLFQKLQIAKSEEDVKDAYVKALGLKKFQKNLIDIQTDEVWFEAKEGGKTSTYAMFTQILHYVQEALNKGEQIPPFLCVIDSHKAALMETTVALPHTRIKAGKEAVFRRIDGQWKRRRHDCIRRHCRESRNDVNTRLSVNMASTPPFRLLLHAVNSLNSRKKTASHPNVAFSKTSDRQR